MIVAPPNLTESEMTRTLLAEMRRTGMAPTGPAQWGLGKELNELVKLGHQRYPLTPARHGTDVAALHGHGLLRWFATMPAAQFDAGGAF